MAVLVAVAAPAPARAADSGKAEELIQQANEQRRQGHDQKALPLLQQAYEIARTPRTLAQLGLAELALGYWLEADEHLEQALDPVAHHPWVDKNRGVLEQSLKSARAHLGALVVEGKPDGAEILVNGKRAGTLPLAGPLKAGEGRVEVEVRAPGRLPLRQVVTLAGGGRARVSVDLAAETVAPPPTFGAVAPPPLPPSAGGAALPTGELPRWRRVLPWSLAGGAALALAFGIWQHAAWRGAQSDFETIRACGADAPMRGSDARCAGLYDDLSSDRTRAVIGYGLAGALGVGAGVLLLVNANGAHRAEATGGVSVGPGDLGVSYALRF